MVNITEQELDFLIKLQHEMLTQDTVGQAAPRFWVIQDERSVPTSEEYCDGYTIFDDKSCEVIATDMESFVRYINEKYNKYGREGIAVYYTGGNNATLVYFNRPVDKEDTLESLGDNETDRNGYPIDRYDCPDVESLLNELNDYCDEEFRLVYTREEEFIVPDTLFLTKKSAEKHLLANRHHYTSKAHAYAMTAWRSPEVENLWNILDKINWNELKEEKLCHKKRQKSSRNQKGLTTIWQWVRMNAQDAAALLTPSAIAKITAGIMLGIALTASKRSYIHMRKNGTC